MSYEQARRLPLGELRALDTRLARLEAQDDLRLLTITTYPHWAGESRDYRAAQREGNRKRRRYLQDLQRAARGLGAFDAVAGVDVLHSGDDIRSWFGAHGIDAAA